MSELEDGAHEFDKGLLQIFDAVEGAYSIVTEAEADKGHITTTGPEAKIIRSFFGDGEIHIGAKKLDPDNATKSFFLFDGSTNSKIANLTVNFPKPAKSELHVYMHGGQGFRPVSGDVWFVFRRHESEHLFIGSMPNENWYGSKKNGDYYSEEIEDEVLQTLIHEPVSLKSLKMSKSMRYPASRKIAQEALKEADFRCEFDPSHDTFISGSSGNPYVEGHHLVPLSRHENFKVSLDVHSNVVALCPNCHRKIHHAGNDERNMIIKHLFELREENLRKSGIEVDLQTLQSFY